MALSPEDMAAIVNAVTAALQANNSQSVTPPVPVINVAPPSSAVPDIQPFDVSDPTQFEDWLDLFIRSEYYLSAPEDRRIHRLMVALGVKAASRLKVLGLSDEDQTDFKKVSEALKTHFMGSKTITYNRWRLFTRRQGPKEPVEEWLSDLRRLITKAKFPTQLTTPNQLSEEFLRDCIILGTNDQPLREALLADSNLTHEKAINKVRIREQARHENSEFDKVKLSDGGLLSTSCGTGGPVIDRIISNNQKVAPQKPGRKCFKCGGEYLGLSHLRVCPARKTKCYKCGELGHFRNKCPKDASNGRSVNNVNAYSSQDEQNGGGMVPDLYIGSVVTSNSTPSFKAKLQIDKENVIVKIDSGADVSVLPEKMIPRQCSLTSASLHLRGPDERSLECIGCIKLPVKFNQREIIEEFYVVRGLKEAIVGKPAIIALDLLRVNPCVRVDAIHSIGETALREEIMSEFPTLFTGLGKLSAEYDIKLVPDAVPYTVYSARNVAIPLQEAVRKELSRMIELGVISKVTGATEWCAPMVVAKKRDGTVRICTDFSKLNQYVLRPRIILPDVEHSLATIGRASIFTKLDAASGFWQVPLAPACRKLTTFITPSGCYFYNRLPFGITSAPEFFQLTMQSLLEGLAGVICHMDDIIIFANDRNEHDVRVRKVLVRLREAGLVLNPAKCVFAVKSVKFLGQVIDGQFVRPDPERVRAIKEFPVPTSITGVRKLLGMLNQLSKNIPRLAELTEPIRALLKKGAVIVWDQPQKDALAKVIDAIVAAADLIRYDVSAETAVLSDASNIGLGAVLMQRDSTGKWTPVSFASRTLLPAERNYASIEKEALGVTWSIEKFRAFLEGRPFFIYTDHLPLVPIFGNKDLSQVPVRIQRFKIRLLPFQFTIRHTPGREMHVADFLSRFPVAHTLSDIENARQIEAYVNSVTQAQASVSDKRFEQIRAAQSIDEECRILVRLIRDGWPSALRHVPSRVRKWHPYYKDLVIISGVIYKSQQIVIPLALRAEFLKLIHDGHFSAKLCQRRAREAVFWPGMSAEIQRLVEQCSECTKLRVPRLSPMMSYSAAPSPWYRIAMDYFFWNSRNFLVIVDEYSSYIEVVETKSLAVTELLQKVKVIFARHGIPVEVTTDSGTQFTSQEWGQFALSYGFHHSTSSPLHHQANGLAERAVRTIKRIFSAGGDVNLALLTLRSTPNDTGYSPAELLFGRKLRTRLPIGQKGMVVDAVNRNKVQLAKKDLKEKQTKYFNQRHNVSSPTLLNVGDRVYVRDCDRWGTISRTDEHPRSYWVLCDDGASLRRNEWFLNKLHPSPCDSSPQPTKAEAILPKTEVLFYDEDNVSTSTQSKVDATNQAPEVPDNIEAAEPFQGFAPSEIRQAARQLRRTTQRTVRKRSPSKRKKYKPAKLRS